jgi:hypothetical protein
MSIRYRFDHDERDDMVLITDMVAHLRWWIPASYYRGGWWWRAHKPRPSGTFR